MVSVFFYLMIFIISSLIFAYGIKRSFKPAIVTGLILPIIISALRFNVGTDYQSYVDIYDNLSGVPIKVYLSGNFNIEIGFYIIMKIASLFSNSINVMFGISSLLTTVFFYFGMKNFRIKNMALSFFLFLTILYPQSFNLVRQYIAIAIAFYAFSFISNNKLLRFMFWILIASAFHASALLLLPVYLIKNLVNNRKPESYYNLIRIIILLITTLMCIPFLISFISNIDYFNKYSNYKDVINNGSNYIFYLKGLVYIVLSLFYRQINASNPKYLYIYLFATIDFALTSIGFIAPMISRTGLYFSIFPLMILSAITCLFKDRLGIFTSYIMVVLYGSLYFIVIYYLNGYSDIFPYSWRFI